MFYSNEENQSECGEYGIFPGFELIDDNLTLSTSYCAGDGGSIIQQCAMNNFVGVRLTRSDGVDGFEQKPENYGSLFDITEEQSDALSKKSKIFLMFDKPEAVDALITQLQITKEKLKSQTK